MQVHRFSKFAAVQAAQKTSTILILNSRTFAAVQAAQKSKRRRYPFRHRFAAVQAAQKLMTPLERVK